MFIWGENHATCEKYKFNAKSNSKEYPKLYKKRDVLTDIWVNSKIDRYVAIDIHLSF